VFHAVIVAVGVVRIGSDRRFGTAGKAVSVSVCERAVVGAVTGGRVGFARIFDAVEVAVFVAVRHSTVIGVGVDGAGGGGARVAVRHARALLLVGGGIIAEKALFGAVGEAVVVRVRIPDVDQAVAVGVVGGVGFVAVFDAVIIGVGVFRVAADRLFLAVGQAVVVVVFQVTVVGAVARRRVGLAGVFGAVVIQVLGAVCGAPVIAVGVERIG